VDLEKGKVIAGPDLAAAIKCLIAIIDIRTSASCHFFLHA
jgi:hypothetical protein